jgi:hypothetical protein
MADIARIDPKEARQHMGAGALLVCAYDDSRKYSENHLEGAISLHDLDQRAATLPRDRELIFYCA